MQSRAWERTWEEVLWPPSRPVRPWHTELMVSHREDIASKAGDRFGLIYVKVEVLLVFQGNSCLENQKQLQKSWRTTSEVRNCFCWLHSCFISLAASKVEERAQGWHKRPVSGWRDRQPRDAGGARWEQWCPYFPKLGAGSGGQARAGGPPAQEFRADLPPRNPLRCQCLGLMAFPRLRISPGQVKTNSTVLSNRPSLPDTPGPVFGIWPCHNAKRATNS